MRHWMIVLPALAFAAGLAGPAHAKGCLKGAVVGGVAGHTAHHGVLGAVGGCAVGHHMASRHEEQRRMDQPPSTHDRDRHPDQ